MRSELYVTPDPQSIHDAEERELRELTAQSSIVSIRRQSREELEREAFWARVDRRQSSKAALSRLRVVRR